VSMPLQVPRVFANNKTLIQLSCDAIVKVLPTSPSSAQR